MRDHLFRTYKKYIKHFNLEDIENTYSQFFDYVILIESAELLGHTKHFHSETIETHINYLVSNLYTNKVKKITPDAIGETFEKVVNRKSIGAYYTPKIVTNYITKESMNLALKNYSIDELNTLDPTCGAGAFLVSAFKYIVDYKVENFPNEDIVKIVLDTSDQISGVDISGIAIEIARYRLNIIALEYGLPINRLDDLKFNLFEGNAIYGYLEGSSGNLTRLHELSDKELSFERWKKFTKPFIWGNVFTKKFNVIVGNPPYIETRKLFNYKPNVSKYFYGNIYADTLERSYQLLSDNGIMGMIVPISFTTTNRMSFILNHIIDNSGLLRVQFYADRPGCLFSGVHQKLNIVFSQKTKNHRCRIFTSNYMHFNKLEIDSLFDNIDEFEVFNRGLGVFSKVSNKLEEGILRKIIKTDGKIIGNKGESTVFLSSRACFWIKVFVDKKISNDYMKLNFESYKTARHVYSILNSNLFFWFWEKVSDCWHIRKSDLKFFDFKLENINDSLVELSYIVEDMLESTKKYIGSKQVDYEYKHKLIKMQLDEIDYVLASMYKLSNEELEYLIDYNLQYRLNGELSSYLSARRNKDV
ncbi:Eco57I restriction-modification methylase domain-containing protein [Mycoplasmatota bacterium WC30]